MPLTKTDLSQIKGIVENANENLAVLVNKGFGIIEKRFELMEKRIEELNVQIRHINARLDTIERDIAEIRKHFVYHRDEFEEVLTRILVIEKKLGIQMRK
mgnify:FL=1